MIVITIYMNKVQNTKTSIYHSTLITISTIYIPIPRFTNIQKQQPYFQHILPMLLLVILDNSRYPPQTFSKHHKKPDVWVSLNEHIHTGSKIEILHPPPILRLLQFTLMLCKSISKALSTHTPLVTIAR